MVLRVDLSRTSVADYVAELAAAGIEGKAVEWAPSAVRLAGAASVTDLPGFSEGRVSVQDAAAQLAAPLLDAQRGMRVLDACAAPGGKTGHLLQHTPGLAEVVAVDIEERRFGRVQENLERLGQLGHAGRRRRTAARNLVGSSAPSTASSSMRRARRPA